MNSALKIAFFISDHGFGHAARTSALIEHLYTNGAFSFHPVIVSAVPEHFFSQSLLSIPFTYLHYKTDVGLVQKDPIHEDIVATLEVLRDFYPTRPEQHSELISNLSSLKPDLIVTDISPLGLVVAEHLKVRSVIFENFLWPWIYDGYPDFKNEFADISMWMNELYSRSDLHIISEPYCHRFDDAVYIGPISRKARTSPETLKSKLQIPPYDKVVLITMGGVPTSYTFLEDLHAFNDTTFVLPGSYPKVSFEKNLRILPHQSDFYHPDLMQLADVVIGKLGYSTIAEVMAYQPVFGWMGRPNFRESPKLAEYVRKHTTGMEISHEVFERGEMKDVLEKIMSVSPGSEINRSGLTDVENVFREFLG